MKAGAQLTVFDQTLAKLRETMPETFDLEVEAHVFRDVPSFAEATRISGTMENMMSEARAMGYVVVVAQYHDYNKRRDVWRYAFRKVSAEVQGAKDGAIDV